MEYFKNVMLKLFETGEAGSLLPVVATVLKFSPEELERCRKATSKWGAAHHAGFPKTGKVLGAGGREGWGGPGWGTPTQLHCRRAAALWRGSMRAIGALENGRAPARTALPLTIGNRRVPKHTTRLPQTAVTARRLTCRA